MNKKYFIAKLIFLALLFTSCTSYYGHREYNEDYRSGTEGVVVSFLNEDFTFYDGDYLNLQLVLQNKGAYDEPAGKIVLSGYDPSILRISDEEIPLPDEFYGKSLYSDEGSTYFASVEEDAPLSLSLGETYDATLQASVCYSYQTIATPTVCLLYDPEDTYICEQEPIALSDQGAPVAVTEVQQTYLQDQVRFVATLQHVGEGTVLNAYDTDAYNACPFTLERDHLNGVAVSMRISGIGDPSCIPSNNYVRLNSEGRGTIVCTFTLREQRSYTTPLEITVDYLYLSTIDQGITIAQRTSSLEREAADFDSSSGIGAGSNGVSSGSGNDCYCSDANMRKWGGCVCLFIDGQTNYCLEGSTEIPVSGEEGDTISYRVYGSSTVPRCGDSPSPTASCPFTGITTVPKKLSIYGTTSDGRTVSERCNLVVRS